MKLPYPPRVPGWLLLLLAVLSTAGARAQQVGPPLNYAADYGLLSGVAIKATNSVTGDPLAIRVQGQAGAADQISKGVQATAGVYDQGSGTVPKALAYARKAQDYCTSLGGSSLDSQLDEQTLKGGVYEITEDAILGGGASLTLTGDTATIIILNIMGSLQLEKQAQVVLDGVLPQHVFWNVTKNLLADPGASFSGVALTGGNTALNGIHFGRCSLLSQGSIILTNVAAAIGSNQLHAPNRLTPLLLGVGDCNFTSTDGELVLDGSFEFASRLPNTIGELGLPSAACYWVAGTIASTDYFYTSSNPVSEVSVPYNEAGKRTDQSSPAYEPALGQNTRLLNGDGYAGLYASATSNTYFEYAAQLNNPNKLLAGHRYYAELSARLAPAAAQLVQYLGLALAPANWLGSPAYTSVGAGPLTPTLVTEILHGALPNEPTTAASLQLSNWVRMGQVYTPTSTWDGFTLLAGNFTPSQGAQGSFNASNTLFGPGAYYYLDNVTLSLVTEAGTDVTLGPACLGGTGATSATLGTLPMPTMVEATYAWQIGNGPVFSTAPNPTVSPTQTTTYTLTVSLPIPTATFANGQQQTQTQTYTSTVTVTVAAYGYAQNAGATYLNPTPGGAAYELGAAGTTTTLSANGGTLTFDGRYHVLGDVRFTNGTFRLQPGTVFFIDSNYGPTLPPPTNSPPTVLTVDGATLHLTGATLQAACLDHLWDGVYLTNGGVLRSSEAPTRRSLLRDMAGGVHSAAGNHYYLSGTDFVHNEYGLYEYAQDKVALAGEGVTNCTFTDGRYGILLAEEDYFANHVFGGNYDQARFSGNTFQDLRWYGLYATAGLGHFENNTFRTCGFAALTTWSVPALGPSTLSHNTIEVPASSPAGSPPGYAPAGILVGDNAQVSGNTITAVRTGSPPSATASAPRIGLCFASLDSGTREQITDNTITGLDWGITAATEDYNGNTITARRNTFHNTGAGIVFFPYYYQNAANPATTTANLTCNSFVNDAAGPADPVGIWLRNKARISNGLADQTVNGTPVGNGNAFIGYQSYSSTTPQHAVVNDNVHPDRVINYRPYDSQYEGAVLGAPTNSLSPRIKTLDNSNPLFTGNVFVAVARTVYPANSPNVCPTNTGVQNSRLAPVIATLTQQLDSLRLPGANPNQQLRLLQALLTQPATPAYLAALDAYAALPEAVGREPLDLHLLHVYRQQRDQASAQRLRARLRAGNPADAELTAYLQLGEALDHLGSWLPGLRPLSPANYTLLSQVAISGTTSARLACRLLRAYEPKCPCHLDEEQPGSAARLSAPAARPTPTYPALTAYPNPATTALHVPYALPAGTTAAELRVYDATGRLVLRQPVAAGAGEAQLATAAWAPGLYQLVLTAGPRILGTQRLAIASQP